MVHGRLPVSKLLVLGANSVAALLPAPPSARVTRLLDAHKLPEAAAAADAQRARLQAQPSVSDAERAELCCAYQAVGLQHLRETLFDEAGTLLFLGALDPRVLVSYFPELRGSLIGPDDGAPLFAGAAPYMPQEASVDDIIATNLVRNYSPHLGPSTHDAPAAEALRQALRYAAEEMLARFLRNVRFQMRTGAPANLAPTPALTTVDTVLAKLYAKSQKTKELHALLSEPHAVLLADAAPVLLECAQYAALVRLYERAGATDGLLDAWAAFADGTWENRHADLYPIDPIPSMEGLLRARRDRALTARWGVWLAHRDPERGFQLLLTRDTGKRSSPAHAAEDAAVLAALQDASPDAAALYLEHLVLERRSTDPALHMQLAHACVDGLLDSLRDPGTLKLWRAKHASYTASPPPTSFLSYFALTTPDSAHKTRRLQAVLFLQWSGLYDARALRERIAAAGTDAAQLLALELAVLEGKLAQHARALTLLVSGLNDAVSAEAYCALGGAAVLPPKTARALADAHGLRAWAAGVPPAPPPVAEAAKRALVGVLLGVYMRGGGANAARTAQLLDAQAMSVDAPDVLAAVPDDWPLQSMTSFLTRSLRRAMHAKHEQALTKHIAMSQNLRVAEETWLVVREQGAVIEEADDSDDDNSDDDELAEKAEKPDVGAPVVAGEKWHLSTDRIAHDSISPS